MSVKVMSAVWELDLPMNDKFVLLAFADHADDSGFCYPSLGRIAWKCGISRDTVRRCSVRFKVSGLMEVLEESNGRGSTPRYRIKTEKGSRLQPFTGKGGAAETVKGGKSPVKGGTAMLPESSFESSVNHKQKPIPECRRKRLEAERASQIAKYSRRAVR
jgi:hypothetical protein